MPISVIIPCYNGRAFFAQAVESVWQQTRRPDEIIVVDDASTDGSVDLAKDLAARSPIPMRVIRLERNSGGPAHPINVGVRAAQGELIAILDQDDMFVPTKLEEQSRGFDDPDVAIVFGCCALFDEPTVRTQSDQVIRELTAGNAGSPNAARLPGDRLLQSLLVHGNLIGGYPGFMFRRQLWEQKGGVDDSLTIASDFDFLCWLCTHGSAVFLNRVHYLRRKHEGNMCRQTLALLLDVANIRERYLRNRSLPFNAAESKTLQQSFTTAAYWLREAGRHSEALHCLALANRIWGRNLGRTLAAAKIAPHWTLHRLGLRSARQPKATPERPTAHHEPVI